MEFVHDRNSNILFSLYGSRVHEMKFHNKMLKLKVSELFRYVDNEEKSFNILPMEKKFFREILFSRTVTWTNAVFLFLIKLFMKGNFQEMPSV